MSKKKKDKKKKFTGQVSKTMAKRILVALGFKTATNWDEAKLTKKIRNLPNLADGAKLEPKMQKRVNVICNALKKDTKVVVIDLDDEAAGKKRAADVEAAVKREDKRKAEKKDKVAKKEKGAKKKAAKKEKSKAQAKKAVAAKEKKPGVIMSVLEFIKNHQPISEKKILSMLKQRFPDKNPESMERSIPRIPGYLASNKGIDVIGKNSKGLYIIKK